MKRVYLVVLLLCIVGGLYGQEIETDPNTNTWITLHTKININEKLYFNNETHLRRSEFLAEWQQIIIRPSFTYKVTSLISFKLGYTKVWNYPYNRESTRIVPEDNFWQRLLITQKFNRSKLEQSYRYELRWLGNLSENEIVGTRFVNRFRHRIKYDREIGNKGMVLSAYHELFISIDDNYRKISFNQNWIYLGAGKKINDHLKLQAGLIRQYIRRSSTRYESNVNMRIDFTYTIN